MSEPWTPHKTFVTGKDMTEKEMQALRLATLCIQKAGGRITFTQAELTATAEAKPILTGYFDPFEGPQGAWVYEVYDREVLDKEQNA